MKKRKASATSESSAPKKAKTLTSSYENPIDAIPVSSMPSKEIVPFGEDYESPSGSDEDVPSTASSEQLDKEIEVDDIPSTPLTKEIQTGANERQASLLTIPEEIPATSADAHVVEEVETQAVPEDVETEIPQPVAPETMIPESPPPHRLITQLGIPIPPTTEPELHLVFPTIISNPSIHPTTHLAPPVHPAFAHRASSDRPCRRPAQLTPPAIPVEPSASSSRAAPFLSNLPSSRSRAPRSILAPEASSCLARSGQRGSQASPPSPPQATAVTEPQLRPPRLRGALTPRVPSDRRRPVLAAASNTRARLPPSSRKPRRGSTASAAMGFFMEHSTPWTASSSSPTPASSARISSLTPRPGFGRSGPPHALAGVTRWIRGRSFPFHWIPPPRCRFRSPAAQVLPRRTSASCEQR
ncbi:nascent polypeptide-associated complex subunit alpha, muscle-specific form-like [Triticum dicoccoides]|uniref:nascent polypeptide-associated complex subunit alpha, muscle-specific form-like n=1 Tax=Triticum dicoccoides TaxID=85692 RepID=UPI00189079A5|nr:nascent polypeptide-associated complex subunit alpha, muscle-specific form-like [Triticum dicoccoides]